jgi:hypothetical protein
MIESGKITPEEGLALLKALPGVDEQEPTAQLVHTEGVLPEPPTPPVEPVVESYRSSGAWESPQAPVEGRTQPGEPAVEEGQPLQGETIHPERSESPDLWRFKGWWRLPFWIAVGVTVLSGLLMYTVWQASGIGFWFACTWFPFLLGVAVMAMAWSSRNLPWLHIRIQQKPGERPQRIAFSFPLPVRLLAWLLRTFGDRINFKGGVRTDTGAKNLDEMVLLLNKTSPDMPLSIHVDEGDDGEKVEIYIG